MLSVGVYTILNDGWPYPYEKPSDKGYPEMFNMMSYWVLFENSKPVGYTGSLNMGKFVFVGNTYMTKPARKKGYHSYLLDNRNSRLPPIPKITILNPIEESQMSHLVKVVLRLGYKPITSYEDVEDIMSKKMYYEVLDETQQIWRMD